MHVYAAVALSVIVACHFILKMETYVYVVADCTIAFVRSLSLSLVAFFIHSFKC